MTILNELDYTCGLSDEELTVSFRKSIRSDNEVRKIKGLPPAITIRSSVSAFRI